MARHHPTDEAFALVMPEVSAAVMQAFLDGFAATLPERAHAALLLDGAGWHIAADLAVPANISLIFPPPYRPNLNLVERVWLYLASASFRSGSSPTSTPSSRAAATPGTASPQSQAASHP